MLYIMRHGKTDWNVEYKLQGRIDIPLNEEGRQMAKAAAEEYKNIHFDVCYCSPLGRAQETAKLVLEGRNIPVITDDRLREMSFGESEGSKNIFGNPQHPMYKFFMDPENWIPSGGAESFDELFARTGNFLNDVVKREQAAGKDILIVGHGAMNNSIISQVKHIPLADFWKTAIPNCKLIELGTYED